MGRRLTGSSQKENNQCSLFLRSTETVDLSTSSDGIMDQGGCILRSEKPDPLSLLGISDGFKEYFILKKQNGWLRI